MQFSIVEPVMSPEHIKMLMAYVNNAISLSDSMAVFRDMAFLFFPILFSLELAKEALHIAQGKESRLFPVLVKFFTVSILLASFNPGGTATYGGGRFQLGKSGPFMLIPFHAIDTFYQVSDAKVEEVKRYREAITKDQGGIFKAVYSLATLFAKLNPVNILASIAYYISNIIGVAVFLSAFVSYAFLLLVGPLAVMCLISEELAFLFRSWVKGVLAYVVVFIVICLALDANMSFQVSAIQMAHGEVGLGFWKTTKVTLYMAVLSLGNFFAALKLGPILFRIGDGKSLLGK